MKIDLDPDDFDLLLIALGMAAGSASSTGDAAMVRRMLTLANAVNANNPNWRPYEVGEPLREGL